MTNIQKKPLFSVVIPVFNICRLEGLFRSCVNSILAQKYPELELIFVDDASTDATPEILKTYSNNDARVRVVRHSSNQRQGQARNTGAEEARGDYLVYCDQDDYLYPDALRVATEIINEHNGPDIIRFRHRVLKENVLRKTDFSSGPNWWRRHLPLRKLYGEQILRESLSSRIPMVCWSRAVKTELARQVKFPKKLPEDFPYTIELFSRAQTFVETQSPLYVHVVHGQSDGLTYGSRNLFNDYVDCFVDDIKFRLARLGTLNKMPLIHWDYCMLWVINTVIWLDNFESADADVLRWGEVIESIDFPSRTMLAYGIFQHAKRTSPRRFLIAFKALKKHYRRYQRLTERAA